MTPKEKAKELVEKYIQLSNLFDEKNGWIDDIGRAKECALICVDEILKCNPQSDEEYSTISFWQEVKQEIEKL